MSARAVVALDLGTTGVRALVVAADGRVLARAWRPLGARFPQPGWLEQDPGEWWERSVEVLRGALAEARVPAHEIASVGVASQRSSAVAWEAGSGRPLAPAIGWQDARTAPRVRELLARGIPASTMSSATKLEWLLAEQPALRAAAAAGTLRLGTPDVWLTDRLSAGAAFATDPSHASCTGLYDLASGDWHPAALALFGIDRAWLPRVVASDAVVGETPPALLGAALPIAARIGDQQAACFAQGVLAPGAGKLTVGTSAMLDVHTGAKPGRPRRGSYPLALWRLADGTDAFCLEGTVVTAGSAIDWLVATHLLPHAGALDEVARSVPDAEEVVFVPALQGLGTPHLDADAHAAFFGITRGTRAAHLVRAVLDGVALRCAEVCDALSLADGPLAVDGGLARSDVFVAALADATGRSVLRAAEVETTGLGAALLAGLATGLFPDAASAIARLPAASRIDPQQGAAERASRRTTFRRAVDRVRSNDPP